MENLENVVIIGSGPAGLAAAIYAGRGMLKPLVIEGAVSGGQPTQTTEVENYPGFPSGVQGVDLVSGMRAQAERFGTKFIEGVVIKIKKESDKYFIICLDNDKVIYSRSVLVATGAEANWLGLRSEERLKGRGVSACATCDGFFFKNMAVAVIGGGDSAMEEAEFLTKYASKVFIVHRRDALRASKIMQEKVLNNPKIEVKLDREIIDFLGEDRVSGIKMKDNKTGKEEVLDVRGIFLAIGHTPSTKFLSGSGVIMDKKGYIYTADRAGFESANELKEKFEPKFRFQTNIKGLFAAGDCMDSMYRQIGTAVGMGIAAEIEIEKYLEENKDKGFVEKIGEIAKKAVQCCID